MAPGSLNPGSGRLPAPTCPPRVLSTCSPLPPRAGCAPPFPTRSPLERASEPPCPRMCPALSPPGPHHEAGKPRHRATRPRARGHTGSSQDLSPPRGRGGGGWTLGTRGPGVQARGEHLGACCHLVAPRGGAAGFPPASEPSPYGDHRALGDPGKPQGAGIPSRARLPGPGRADANGRDGEASMVRKEMGARPGCPVLTLSRPLPPCFSKPSRPILTLS